MKSFILSILFFAFLPSSFAQKYEYNILGEHFSDTLYNNVTSTTPLNGVRQNRKAIFEKPTDTSYIYHQVGEGENIEYILNLYQICAPCLSKWNNIKYPDFGNFRNQPLHTGEYLKVAIKKDYEQGTTAIFKTRTLYQNFPNRIYIYDITDRYGINTYQLREWNNLNENVYYIEDMQLIVGQVEYKYACPCLE